MSELLSFEHVEKVYPHGRHRDRVLADVSFRMGPGHIVAVIGDRFGGKTTLLRLAAGITAPTCGTVRLEGVDLSRLDGSARDELLTERVSWCGRDGPGLELELRDFVGLPTLMRQEGGGHPHRNAERVLAQLGVEDCAHRCWDELSKWEQMCASLARGIACQPRLLLVDDLLDGLGTARTLEAGGLLRRLALEVGCGVLLTVSDVEAAMLADCILSLQQGRLRPVTDQTADAAAPATVVALDERRTAQRPR